MRAMVLAAGYGRRLRPLTDATPKPLIKVGGVPLLAGVIGRLVQAGVEAVIVNAHHLAPQIEGYLKENSFGVPVEISLERELLGTGGGLKKAAGFFKDSRPFFLHNADVFSGVDLKALYRFHAERPVLATLSVRDRPGSRRVLFSGGRLRGLESEGPRAPDFGAAEKPQALAFDGIHVLSPEIFKKMPETGAFSIIDVYLRLAKAGEVIQAFRSDEFPWADAGSWESLEALGVRADSAALKKGQQQAQKNAD